MSGGAYDYVYAKVDAVADDLFSEVGFTDYSSTVLRQAFKDHLRKVAAALKACEWNDSGDGAPDEAKLILECIAPQTQSLAPTVPEQLTIQFG